MVVDVGERRGKGEGGVGGRVGRMSLGYGGVRHGSEGRGGAAQQGDGGSYHRCCGGRGRGI